MTMMIITVLHLLHGLSTFLDVIFILPLESTGKLTINVIPGERATVRINATN